MQNVISKYYADDGKGYAVIVHVRDGLVIEYYDENNKFFFNEEFFDKSLRYVEDAAENWALGIKKLDQV